ncbi:MAG: DPP IV N-terminal domain-containing protein, partial [Anaerolineales bacterium]|nr:DPP IV N-terminal domain-containing protein [Anaerolineales bacterium]
LAVLGGFLLNARQSQSSGMLPSQTAAANSLAAFTPGMAPASYTPALATHVPTLATSRPASTAIAGLPAGAVAASLTPFVTATPVGGGSGQISFAGEISGTIQVWLMDLDGSNLKQLTNLAEGACQPDWSPDGARLVFTSPCKGNKESYPGAGLFIINVDGTNLTPLPNVPGGDYDPAWSPDGNFIAFTSLRTSGRPRLYLINLVDLSVERLSQPYAIDMQPAWSPDGMRIAFVSRQEGPTDIWVMDRDGGDQQRYTQGGAMINSHPAWSQDGNVLLFTQQESPGGVPSLAAASYNEGVYHEYRFELGPIPLREAKYSPDGLWLVVESWTGYPNHDIYIMSSSGASRTQISTPLGLEFDPCWRPAATPK